MWQGLWSHLVQPLLEAGLVPKLDQAAQGYTWLSFLNILGRWFRRLSVQSPLLLNLR